MAGTELRAACAIFVVTALLSLVRNARAQVDDGAAALELFEEGKRLTTAGQLAEGCPKLLASYTLVPKLGTLLNLADCYEKAGKTASAWVRFTEAAAIADRTGQETRAEFARQHVATLVPRLTRIVINVTAPIADGIEVRRDGLVVNRAAFGLALPVDPGAHTIEVRAPERRSWSTTLDLGEADRTIVDVPVLVSEGEPIVAPPPPVVPPPRIARPAPKPRGDGQRTAAFVIGGIGVAGVAASLITGLIANATYAQSTDAGGGCVNDRCTQAGINKRADAEGTATIATLLFVGGAALTATGVVLYLTAPVRSGGGLAVGSTW